MSGGGSGDSGGGGGGGPTGDGPPIQPPPPLNCNLAFSTTLASPNPTGVAAIAVTSILDVTIVQQGTSRAVVAQVPGGPVVGAITNRVFDLLRCIALGNQYQATVLSIGGGAVSVQIDRI